jgi:hypothetical protein
MDSWSTKTGLLLVLMIGIAGCSSTTSIAVKEKFPQVLAEPRDIHAAIVMGEGFRTYVARPNANTTIDIGNSQADLLDKAFRGLFTDVSVVGSKQEVAAETDLVITPSVREVQVSTPSESYLNVYEVWIKYNLDIETADGTPIDSWFMPAYGKTPDSFMLSRSEAIREAAVVALRDAGAKLLLDFYRIPSINGWLREQERR